MALPRIFDPGVHLSVAVVPEQLTARPVGTVTGPQVTLGTLTMALATPEEFTDLTHRSLYALPGSLIYVYEVLLARNGIPAAAIKNS